MLVWDLNLESTEQRLYIQNKQKCLSRVLPLNPPPLHLRPPAQEHLYVIKPLGEEEEELRVQRRRRRRAAGAPRSPSNEEEER